ncbi:MAG: glycosyltransferase family 4 protein [Endozoicomonas sp. (ex Botrylloides leachii)]|nr:glycosyltransferase family 4 protein [Endozoicomonas sp. (ex Botrylloides leachii)]
MKNVWILNHYAQEPSGAGGTRHYSLARHLLSHNWRSSVIAASVELNTGRQRLQVWEKKHIDYFHGIPFLWIHTPQYTGNGPGRMKNMLAYAFRALMPDSTRELNKPDVVIGSSVHPFAAASGAILAWRFKVPFIFEVRDLWPQTLIDLGRLRKNSIITRGLCVLEKWLYKRADRIVVLLPKAEEYIVPLGIPAQKIVWIPNGVELTNYPKPIQPQKNDIFTLMYFGAHGQANGLGNLLKAMALLQKHQNMQHVRLRMIGEGPLKQDLVQLAHQLELTNVQFEEPVAKQQIPALASEADGFVITVKNLPKLYRYGISMNKIFDYLAAARPTVIASSASNNPIEEAKAGITVQPDDPEALAEAIAKLVIMTPAERANLGHSGRVYVEKNHSYAALAERFANMLDELIIERR